MNDTFSFNKGIDYWNANYYPDLAPCFTDIELADQFGHFFCDIINQGERLQLLCNAIRNAVTKNSKYFKKIKADTLDELCFVSSKVEYDIENKYIRFPDFKDPELSNYLLRIDINPCIGHENSMTKIYCIPKIQREVLLEEIHNFVIGAKELSEIVLDELTNIYIRIFNQFISDNNLEFSLIKEENKKNKIKVISLCIGSDSAETNTFLNSLDVPDQWRDYCNSNQKAKYVVDSLKLLNNSLSSSWKLDDYEWFSHEIVIDETENKKTKVLGYLGFAEGDNIRQYIGLANSIPRNLLLPIQLYLIRNCKKTFQNPSND